MIWSPDLQYLSEVMTRHGLAVHESGRGSLDDLEAEVGPGHELEHHVEHPLAGVGLQQLHDVGVFEHVADGRLPLQVVQGEPRGGGELGHVHDLDSELLGEDSQIISSQSVSHLVCVSVDTSPDHTEGAFANDLVDLVNVIEEDFLLIGHFFRRLKPGRQLGCCSAGGLPESCDTVCAVTQICALVLYPTDFEPPRPLTIWRPSLHNSPEETEITIL